MVNVIIIHGACGHPQENWFPWLKYQLGKLGCKVFVPKFPTPVNQSLDSWMEVFEGYKKYLSKDTIVVGHSCGVPFLLNVLERIEKPIRAAFFVSGFIRLLNNNFDQYIRTFSDKSFNWDKIKHNCKSFYMFHSDNDRIVPINKGIELSKHLTTDIMIIKNAGHINWESGYTHFEMLLEKIKPEIV